MDKIVLLTGERETGKTHLCQRVMEEAQRRGFSCAGVLSRALFEGQQKTGISLVDVASGEERLLATADDFPHGVRWGRYRFVPSSLAWGGDLLAKAAPCDLLVVDELGPLELELGQGLVKALDVLVRGGFSLALVVVRPALLNDVRELLEGRQPVIIEVTLSNRDQLPMRILSILEEVKR
jgi:nucleoside-triphosphatase THEP1